MGSFKVIVGSVPELAQAARPVIGMVIDTFLTSVHWVEQV
jgi:hypothetical protein